MRSQFKRVRRHSSLESFPGWESASKTLDSKQTTTESNMKEYSIAFLGNITIFAESYQDARNKFDNADLRPWAEIDTVQLVRNEVDSPFSDDSQK
jgi:hypothetical protein